MKKWFERILFHSHAQPEMPAIVMEDRVITYAMLRDGIERCARRLNDLGLDREGPIAVIVSSPLRHLVLCYALHRIGIPSISLAHTQSGIEGLSFPAILHEIGSTNMEPSCGRHIEVTDDGSPKTQAAAKNCRPALPIVAPYAVSV